jgi:hypothetical protein
MHIPVSQSVLYQGRPGWHLSRKQDVKTFLREVVIVR